MVSDTVDGKQWTARCIMRMGKLEKKMNKEIFNKIYRVIYIKVTKILCVGTACGIQYVMYLRETRMHRGRCRDNYTILM